MRAAWWLLGFAVAGCTARGGVVVEPRPEVLRDVEGYAVASCLTLPPQPWLRDQGDAWASVILQRMQGGPEALVGVAEAVRREEAKGDMAVIRDETGPARGKALPLLHCGESVDRPAVRAAIRQAVAALAPFYRE